MALNSFFRGQTEGHLLKVDSKAEQNQQRQESLLQQRLAGESGNESSRNCEYIVLKVIHPVINYLFLIGGGYSEFWRFSRFH